MRRGSATRVAAGILAVFVGSAAAASAQNLLVNPNFDTDVSGWSPVAGCGFDATRGTPAPGSLLCTGATINLPGGTLAAGATQCVTGITPGTAYTFGGSTLLTSAPAGVGARHFLTFHSDAGCTTGLSSSATALVTATGSWIGASEVVVAPPGTVAASFGQFMTLSDAVGQFEVNFDRTFLTAGGDPVPSMSGVMRMMLGIALVAVALGAMRRVRIPA